MNTGIPVSGFDGVSPGGAQACVVMDFKPYGCLHCPLPACLFDDVWEDYRRHRRALLANAVTARVQAGESVAALAERTGLAARTIHRWLKGARDD